MAVDFDVSMPFDGQSAFEGEWRDIFGSWLQDYVVQIDNGLTVYGDSTGRQVKVRTGRVAIDGEFGQTLAEKTLPVAVNSSGNPRIDRVVARLDYTAHKIVLDVKAGTPGVSPSPPALTQNSVIREVTLAQVGPLASGYTTIAPGNVTDERLLWSPRTLPSYASPAARSVWTPLPPTGSHCLTLNDGQYYIFSDGAWEKQRSKRNSKSYHPVVDEDTGSNATWPVGLTRSVDIPQWATVARIMAKIGEPFAFTAQTNTQVDCRIGSVIADAQRYRWPVDLSHHTMILVGDADVSAIAGTTQTLRTFANNVSGTGVIRVDNESSHLLEVEFR